MSEFLSAIQAIARGASTANCGFIATSAADTIGACSSTAWDHMHCTKIRAEDSASAVAQCIDAAKAGEKVMAMIFARDLGRCGEDVGLAQAAEVPLVVLCFGGDIGSGATAAPDGDVLLAGNVVSGGCPLPVWAAADVASAYRLTRNAFNIAERLRTPVILMISPHLAQSEQDLDLEGDDAAILAAPASFDADHTGAALERHTAHLMMKISAARENLEQVNADADPRADVLILAYGLTGAVAHQAVSELRQTGKRVAGLTLFSLWPIPEIAIRRAVTDRIRRVIVPELNIGLYAGELRKVVHSATIEPIVRYDGGLIHPQRIVQHVLRSPCG